MVSFTLKVVWFSLCMIGTIASWIVLVTMAASINTYWLPILYCVGLAMLEGIFCLGMMYNMDPFRMPRTFCLAQIFTISFSVLFLTGVCLTIILAMTASMLWPSSLNVSPQSILRWRWRYLIQLVLIPTMFSVIQLGLVIKFDAAQPSDNIHCDVTGSKLWISLFGYAGMPMLESIPCFFVTSLAAVRVSRMYKSQQHITNQQLRKDTAAFKAASIHMEHISKRTLEEFISGPLEAMPPPPFGSQLPSSSCSSGAFAGPGRPIPHPVFLPRPDHAPFKFPSESSDLFPAALPDSPRSRERYALSDGLGKVDIDESQDTSSSDSNEVNTTTSDRANDALGVRTFDLAPAQEEGNMILDGFPRQSSVRWDNTSQMPTPHRNFLSLIWRLILFLFVFFLIQILVTLSTLIDIGHERLAPTPFGTQHVALLLAAWGPSAVFAHSPGIRKCLMFRRR